MSDNLTTSDENGESQPAKKLSMAERVRIARKEQYQKAKLKQKAYLASPEVQKRLSEKRDKLKEMRKERANQMKSRRREDNSAAKKSLSEDAKNARLAKQAERDQELLQMVRPALTLIQGGNQTKETHEGQDQ